MYIYDLRSWWLGVQNGLAHILPPAFGGKTKRLLAIGLEKFGACAAVQ